MKKMFAFIVILIVAIPVCITLPSMTGANDPVKKKVYLVKQSLIKSGYPVKWITISQKRSKFLNSILPNSAKNSHHLRGNAIDVYVFDVNGDAVFDAKDVSIVRKHNRLVEKSHPELKGGFGTYLNTITSYRTIHFDTRGRTVEYNK